MAKYYKKYKNLDGEYVSGHPQFTDSEGFRQCEDCKQLSNILKDFNFTPEKCDNCFDRYANTNEPDEDGFVSPY